MKVKRKQSNSRKCIICGMENNWGVKASFYEMEDDSVVGLVQFGELHQSYPGRVHGGMVTAMLDEVAGRALWSVEPTGWAVTGELKIRFFKPTPYGKPLKAVGRIVRNSPRAYVAVAEIFDGELLLARSEGTYIKLSATAIAQGVDAADEMIYQIEDGVAEID